MQEICLEFIKGAKERLKYPIVTVYVVVLCLYNWDILSFYFLSDASVEDKIYIIKLKYQDHWGRIFWPLLKAVIITVLAPAIMWGLDYFLHFVNSGRRVIKKKTNTEIWDYKLAFSEYEYKMEQNRTGQKTISELNEQIEQYKKLYDTEKQTATEQRSLLIQYSEDSKKERDALVDTNKKLQTLIDTYQSNNEGVYFRFLEKLPKSSFFSDREAVLITLKSINEKTPLYEDLKKAFIVGIHSYTEESRFLAQIILPELLKQNFVKQKTNGNKVSLTLTEEGEKLFHFLKSR